MRTLTIILAAVLLAGCGGGDEEASAPSPEPTTQASPAELEAMDAEARSAVRNAVTELEVCFVDAQTYKGCELSRSLDVGEGLGQVRIAEHGATTYEVAARSESGIAFSVTRQGDGSLTRECAPAGLRDCTAAGAW